MNAVIYVYNINAVEEIRMHLIRKKTRKINALLICKPKHYYNLYLDELFYLPKRL